MILGSPPRRIRAFRHRPIDSFGKSSHRLHALPASSHPSRARGARKGAALRGMGLLGETRARLWGPAGPASGARPGPGRPMAVTVPDGSLPATAAASGCSARSSPPGSPTGPFRSTAVTACGYTTAMSPPRSAARAPGNKPLREEFDTCRVFLVRELTLLARARVVVALVPRRAPRPGAPDPITPAPVPTRAGPRPRGREFDRLLSPESAEHLHGAADGGDAGCGLPAGSGPTGPRSLEGSDVWALSVTVGGLPR